MSVSNVGYHTKDGLYFRRGREGRVEVQATGNRFVELPPNVWAHAVASVCQGGETNASYRAALLFHGYDTDESVLAWPDD